MANKIKYQIQYGINEASLNNVKKQLNQLKKLTGKEVIKIDGESATQSLGKIIQQAQYVEKALREAYNPKLNTTNIQTFNKILKESGSSMQKVYEGFARGGETGLKAFRSLSSQVLSTNLELKQTHTLLDKMATTFFNAFKYSVATKVLNSVTGSIQQAWGYTKSLDSSLNDIRIVTGKSADEMQRFAVEANNVAKNLGKSTTDYTNAALIYAQQGLNDKEVAARAEITLKTANVTGQSADAVSEQLTAVWNGYKVTAEQAQIYVDRLAAIAASTASDLQELSVGMGKVASAANAMGVGEEQLAAQLSTIISATKQAPESVGTALRTVYARISDIQAGIDQEGVSLGNYSGKMADLGFNVLDMNGKLRDMGQVMEQIGEKWDSLTREQQIYLAQTMAGQRQYNNLLALFDNFEEYNKALNTAQDSMGTLQEQQDIYADQINAHLNTLKASVEDIYDSLIDIDSTKTLIDALSSLANLTANWIDGMGGGIQILRSLGSIGFTVFSSQIAKGIETTANNLRIAENNAKSFDQALETTKQWRAIEGLDKASEELLSYRQQLLQLSKAMTPEQFAEAQTLLNDIVSSGNQISENSEKIAKAEEQLKKFSQKSLTDTIREDDPEKIGEQFTEAQKHLQKLTGQIKVFGTEFKENFAQVKAGTGSNYTKVFNDLKKEIVNTKVALQEFKNTKVFKSLSDSSREEIGKIEKALDELYTTLNNKTISSEAKEAAVQEFFKQYKNGINNVAKEAKISFQELQEIIASPEAFNQSRANVANINKMVEEFKQKMTDMQKTLTMGDWIKAAGGIGQFVNGIRQIQHLGAIWSDKTISESQRFLQIISNLSFSLPMLIGGFKNAAGALKLYTVATNKQFLASLALNASTSKATVEQLFHFGALRLVRTQAGKTALAISILDKAFLFSGVGVAVIALASLVTILGMVTAAAEKSRKQQIEANRQAIQQSKQTQEELEKHKELYNSIEELNKKREEGAISRAELKSGIEDLIDQYGLEGEAADRLRNNYDNLIDTIKQLREEQAKEKSDAARKAYNAAGENLQLTLQKNSAKELSLGDNPNISEDSRKILEEVGFKNQQVVDGVDFTAFSKTFNTDDLKEFVKEYSQVEDALKKIDKSDQDSEWYKSLKQWLETYKEQVVAYQEAIKDLEKYQTQFTTLSKNIDYQNIQNANNYLNIKQQIEKAIEDALREEGYEDDQLTKKQNQLSTSFLRVNASNSFNQFEEMDDILNNIGKSYSDLNNNLKNNLSQLNDKQLDFLYSLDKTTLSTEKNLEEAVKYAQKLEDTDLTHINKVFTDEEAAEQYSIYNSLEEQIKSGKNISKSEFEGLLPSIQEFFTVTANKTYELTGSIDEFYKKVNELKLEGFRSNVERLSQQIRLLQELKKKADNNEFDFKNINRDTSIKDDEGYHYNQQIVEEQLKYLEGFAESDLKLKEEIGLWRNDIDKLSEEQVKAILDKVDQYNPQMENLDKFKQDLAKAQQQLHDAMIPTDENVDASALKHLSDLYEDYADQIDGINDAIKENSQWAKEAAEAVLRFDDAITNLVDNYDDWSKILKNGSESEFAQIADALQDAYADLLDLAGDEPLSDKFLSDASNLDRFKAAIDGNIDAYNELMELAQQDIQGQITIKDDSFWTNKQAIEESLLSLQNSGLTDIEIDARLQTDGYIDALQSMLQATNMTAAQAESYLKTLGFDATVVESEPKVKESSTTEEYWQPATYRVGDPLEVGHSGGVQYYPLDIVEEGKWVSKPGSTSTVIPGTSALKITSLHQTTGGNIKYQQASNGGGSKGQARRAKAGKSSGGGGKGGSAQGPDTSKKDTKKPLEDTRDIYHDINIELEQINHHLDRAQKKQDRLYGKQLLDNLNEQTAILEQHKKKLKQKQGIQQEDLKNQQKTLKNLGVEFDKYGNIANYMSLLTVRQAEINARTADYNKLIEQYNQSTDKTVKEQISKEAEAINKQIQTAENDYKQLEKKIKDYDKLRQDMEDLVDDIEEETQKQIELNIQKFRMSLEIRLDMGEAEKDWNQFQRKVLEHTDVLKGTEFEKIFADAFQQIRDLTSYFNVGGSIGTLQALTNQLIRTRQEIQEIDQNGFSDIYGDNKAQAMEHLQKDLAELSKQLIDVEDLIDNINQAYLDTIDDIEKQFDKQIEDYEYINDLIQHDIDLLELLYGDKNYDAMDKYFTTLAENNLKQLDSLRKQREFWGKEWEAAVARGDTNAAAQFEQNYKKTIKNLNKLIEDSAKNIQDKYTNAIEKIFDILDKKLSDGKGTDYLNTQWQLMNKNADEYLDTINTAFAIQETEQKYQDAINDTKNIKNQQALKKLMDEQLGILRNKEKVTQYDVERAEKLLQIEQARIALQDMQSAKTTLRLKRDSQGNYSYQYVADDDAVDEAKAKLAEAQNDLYNFDKQRYKANLDDMLAAWKDFQSEYKDIVNDVSLTEEQRIRNLALLREQYGQYINDKTLENAVIRGNLQQSAFNDYAALYDMDVQNYQKMTDDERNILMGELVPMWKSGIQEMADTITGEGGFLPACQDGFEAIEEATQDYEDELSNMADVAGISLTEVKTGVDDLASTFGNLVEANDDLITRMNTEINTIQGLKNAAANLVKEYQNVYGAAVNAVSGINDYIRAQQAEAAAAVSSAQYKYNGIINAAAKARQALNNLGFDTSGSGNASGSGSGADGTGSSIGNASANALKELLKRKSSSSSKYVSPGGGVKVLNAYTTQYYDSGGYTGDWNSSDGKLAVLHEKELVLNAKDTSNILNVVKIVRSISDSLKINTAQRLFGLKASSNRTTSNNSNDLEQNVHIEATFPNVDSKRQIEEAFDDLINLAAQRALR